MNNINKDTYSDSASVKIIEKYKKFKLKLNLLIYILVYDIYVFLWVKELFLFLHRKEHYF